MSNSMQLQLQKIQSDYPRNIAIQIYTNHAQQENVVIWSAMHGVTRNLNVATKSW